MSVYWPVPLSKKPFDVYCRILHAYTIIYNNIGFFASPLRPLSASPGPFQTERFGCVHETVLHAPHVHQPWGGQSQVARVQICMYIYLK